MQNSTPRSIACICHGVTLEEVVEKAQELEVERFEEIPEKTGYCQCCQRCIPYLKELWDK
jgi:bacterioferritin-associated ferredoxin